MTDPRDIDCEGFLAELRTLFRYDDRPLSRAEASVRQIISTANYSAGNDLTSLVHLWLNYHVEHHVWPDIPLLQYQRAQPKLKALCAKYGIPFVQEPLARRLIKMAAVVVGNRTMKHHQSRSLRSAQRLLANCGFALLILRVDLDQMGQNFRIDP